MTFNSLSLTNSLNFSLFSFSTFTKLVNPSQQGLTYSYTKESLTTRLSTLLLTPVFVHTNLFSPINSLETFSFNSSFNTEPKTFNNSSSTLVFSGNQFQTSTLTDNTLNSQSEGTFFFRYQRALNPVFKYDYKLGNYFTKEDTTMTPFMFTTAIDVTGGIRKSS